jgi:hypothetical protein
MNSIFFEFEIFEQLKKIKQNKISRIVILKLNLKIFILIFYQPEKFQVQKFHITFQDFSKL